MIQIRNVSHNLAAPNLANFDLADNIRKLCLRINKTEMLVFTFIILGNPFNISEKHGIALYQIIQELSNNVLKHSQAKKAEIILNYKEEQLQLTAKDNGIGFTANDSQNNEGIGMQNIASRVKYLKAHYLIDSNSNGTTVRIILNKKELELRTKSIA